MNHRTSLWFGSDGSYIIYQRFERGQWRTRSRWLIPGTEQEHGRPDWEAIMKQVMARFPKTLAYLANN